MQYCCRGKTLTAVLIVAVRRKKWLLRGVHSSLFAKSHSIDYKSIQHYKYKFIEYYRNGAILFKFEMKTTRNKNEWWCRKVITGKYSATCKINFNNKRETLQVETAPRIPYHNFVTTTFLCIYSYIWAVTFFLIELLYLLFVLYLILY